MIELTESLVKKKKTQWNNMLKDILVGKTLSLEADKSDTDGSVFVRHSYTIPFKEA